MILAIDPGPTESAYVLLDPDTYRAESFGLLDNAAIIQRIRTILEEGHHVLRVAIEMIASYGMPVGADVFDTCIWIGRFYAEIEGEYGYEPALIKRLPVKLHHCKSAQAKDSNVRQALVDRFAAGFGNHGKGTKANPSPFFGFRRDIWAAYAIAVYVADAERSFIP